MSNSYKNDMDNKRGFGFWILISIGILFLVFLLTGQTFSLINYNAVVSLGLQESVEEISQVGIAFAKGFAFADTVAYIPLLLSGVIGLLKRKKWGVYMMFASCAISVYWPLVHLFAIFIERDAINLQPEKYVSFPITLSLIILYGLWGMWYLYRNQKIL